MAASSVYQPTLPKCPSFIRKFQSFSLLQCSPLAFPSRIQASSAASPQPESGIQPNDNLEFDLFSCPVCYEPLIRKGPRGLNLPSIYRPGFKCRTCNKSYSSKDMFLDLTITAGSKDYNESQPAGTELFRSPLVSFLYERGWRQSFNLGGSPGPDEEFKMAQEYFRSAAGGLLVDVSCGSGLLSRKFAESGTYSGVVALDFSESSIDAVHAGAALHCWPSSSNAVAEITRVLRSGGIFVGTTFIRPNFRYSSVPAILRPFRQRILSNVNFLSEKEIEDLCGSCGLINYTSKVQQSFIMFSAHKP